jgi:DNA repair protein RecN (Recombination protein N)
MLEYLGIENLAVISKAEIEFGKGLNIITGETGAGKSMVVQALSLLRGSRASASWVRAGEERAKVEAVLDLESVPRIDGLDDEFGLGDDPTLNIERIVREGGKGRIKINGSLTRAKVLHDFVGSLIELSSQHDQQILLSPASYLSILDEFNSSSIIGKELVQTLEQLDLIAKNIDELKVKGEKRSEEIENLKYKFHELSSLEIQPSEKEELLLRRKRLRAANEIMDVSVKAESIIYSDDESILEVLHSITKELEALSETEPQFKNASGLVADASGYLEEAVSILRGFTRIEDDADSLEWVESRLHTLERILSKYSCKTEEDAILLIESTKDQMDILDNFDSELNSLIDKEMLISKKAWILADKLSNERKSSGKILEKSITAELQELGFNQAKFIIRLTHKKPRFDSPSHRVKEDKLLSSSGYDAVDFLFDPNPGEEPRPISSGASGGELSRIHLAIKVALSKIDRVITTVYDEVDAGIGGPIGTIVGAKLKLVAEKRQIICITHLPQIAAFADTHFVVYKELENNRTYTRIRKLNNDERLKEIARMLGGITPQSLEHAKALLTESK